MSRRECNQVGACAPRSLRDPTFLRIIMRDILAKIEAAKATAEEIKRADVLPTSRIELAVNLEVALLEIEVMLRAYLLQAGEQP